MTAPIVPPASASILVVDDQPDVRMLLRRWLSHEGYTVHEAVDGNQALTAYERLRPDIVLLDALMPGLNGFETCAQLHANFSADQPLVVMITALSDQKFVDQAFEAGAADYATKPIHWPILRQRIRRLIQVKQAESALRGEVVERKRAEETLQQERNLLRTLIDHLPDHIYVKDNASKYILANAASLFHLGNQSLEDVVGKTDFDFHSQELATQYYVSEQAILQSGEALLNWEEPGIDHVTGEAICLLSSKIPLRDSQDRIIGLVGVNRDITERKRIEKKLSDYQDRLEQLVENRTAELTTTNDALQAEITERKRIEAALEYRVEFEQLISTISARFIDLSPEGIDEGITRALQVLGQFVGVDCSYIYLLSGEGTNLNLTYQWMADGIPANRNNFWTQRVEDWSFWLEKLKHFENIVVSGNGDDPPVRSAEKDFLASRGIISFLAVPMIYGGALIGFLGFETLRSEKLWPTDVITLHRVAAEIFVNALEHKRAERALHKSEEQLRRITDNMLDMICQIDLNGVIQYVSPSCWNVLGYPPGVMLGQSLYTWIHPEDADGVKESIQDVYRIEYRYLHADGHYLWLETLGNFLFTDDAASNSIILASRDITARKEAEKQLQDLNQLKTEFLSTAAHELRTPLTSIRGFSEILLTRVLDEARQRRFITLINEQSTNLGVLIDDLLDISRLEAKRELTLALESVDILGLLDQVVTPFAEMAAQHHILVEGFDNCPHVTADPFRLAQVCKNLLSNAVKYSPSGGTIWIRSRIGEKQLEISVQDEGIGMTQDQQTHLFEKFYRADASNVTISGTGLGLAISKLIVEMHGGSIWVDSEYGAGTTFHFTVPLALPVQP